MSYGAFHLEIFLTAEGLAAEALHWRSFASGGIEAGSLAAEGFAAGGLAAGGFAAGSLAAKGFAAGGLAAERLDLAAATLTGQSTS